MASNYCLIPSGECSARVESTGECISSTNCRYKACFFCGLERETELLLRNMCAIQIQNAKILALLKKQNQK